MIRKPEHIVSWIIITQNTINIKDKASAGVSAEFTQIKSWAGMVTGVF
jgi:hypothetical protein